MTINRKYFNLLKKIYEEGFVYEDPNRKGVIRKQIPFCRLEHNFDEGFPIIGLKRCYPKSAFGEMQAFLLGENTLNKLKSRGVNFWDADGYNFYLKHMSNQPSRKVLSKEDFLKEVKKTDFSLGAIYPLQIRNWNRKLDQLVNVIDRLKKEPLSTKNIITMWNPSDEGAMALTPCHRTFEFIVNINNKGDTELYIQWEQSSVDTFLGLPMNILYYSYMCYVIAHYLGFTPRGIIANLSNVHLYDNSFSAVEDILLFTDKEIDLPKVNITTNFPNKDVDIDTYLKSLSYKDNILLQNYTYIKEYKVPMLPYSK